MYLFQIGRPGGLHREVTVEHSCIWVECAQKRLEGPLLLEPFHLSTIVKSLLSPLRLSIALPSGIDHKPKECLGLLECMYANLQLQTQFAQQQMAILENLQASMTQLAPGKESKNSSLPALSR